MNTDLKSAIEAIDSTLARLCEILTRVESLVANPETAPADPLAGHPELPPEQPEDPTRRVLPWGDLPEPPEAPAGKVWVYRGAEWPLESIGAEGRELRYLSSGAWMFTYTFSCDLPHIELVDEPARPDRDDQPRDPNRFNA